MWAIIKFDKKKLNLLIQDLKKNLGDEFEIYLPKTVSQNYKNNKLRKRENLILGDYLFCFHREFEKDNFLKQLNFLRGLKYFLSGFKEFQHELKNFIYKCKELEDEKGFIKGNFFDLIKDKNYKFCTGPFAEKVFKLINLKNDNLNILIGNINTRINKKDFIFKPV